MEYIYNERLGEGYYKTTLKNNLTVLVYPIANKSSAYVMLSAHVGSINLDYEADGKHITVPEGIAHFLEHKMFENADGIDAFELFSKIGASAIAYTSFDRTCYLFEASLNIDEALRVLIGFVGSPYFSSDTVAKEQGIITQEIKMYQDHPSWRQLVELLKLLYNVHPIRNDIAGTVESIALIDENMLYGFYNAFYRPGNMVLALSGNVDPAMVENICHEEYDSIDSSQDCYRTIEYIEEDCINNTRIDIEMPISSPQFCYGFKEIPFSSENQVKKELALDMLLDIISGPTSDLCRRLYDSNLINEDLSYESLSGDDYLCIIFSGESQDPQKVIESINVEIDRFKDEGIDDKRFVECKRSYIGGLICDYEDISAVATKLTYTHFKGVGAFDILEIIEEITKDDVEVLLKDMLRKNMSAASFIFPSVPDNTFMNDN